MYALLLRLYPRAFRERYAQEMMRTFRDRLRHESTARLWIDVLEDAVVSIPRQHWVREPHPIYPLSAAPLREATATVMRAMIAWVLVGLTAPFLLLPGPPRIAKVIAAAVLLPLALLTLRRAGRASQIFKTYQADTGPDSVTVTFAGAAPLTLRRNEIVGLHVFEKTGLRIQAADPARDLWVPARTAAYVAVNEHVSGWAPTTVTPFLHDAADNLPRVAILTLLAIVVPTNLAGFVAGAALVSIIATLRKRNLPALRKLISFAPAVVLFPRFPLTVVLGILVIVAIVRWPWRPTRSSLS
jgi:hypothetical protein